MRRSALTLTFVLVLVATACSSDGASDDTDAPADLGVPFRLHDGSLRSLVMATEVADDGSPTPQLSFTTDDVGLTALVGLAEDVPDGAHVTVTWYRLVGIDDREPLFSHEIEVGSGGVAFSQGVTPSGIAPGVYEVEATLGADAVHVPWVVEAAGSEDGAVAQAVGDEDWNTPGAGDSGWNEPEQPAGPPPPPGPCDVTNLFTGFDPYRTVSATTFWVGTCTSMRLDATVSGPATTVASVDVPAGGGLGFLRGDADVCALPGGSDLPGAVVTWTATGSEGATATAAFSLPDFGPTLEALIQSVPEPGHVEAGQRIDLRGMAVVFPPALGIEKLTVLANDQAVEEVGNAAELSSPEPCNDGRLGAVTTTHYEVPAVPPSRIEICARAIGFDGTQAEHCIAFSTGEAWTGTAHLAFDGNTAAGGPTFPCRGTADFTFEISVGGDGQVEGSGTIAGEPYVCESDVGPLPGLSPAGPFEVLGTKSADGFDLVILPGAATSCCAAWPFDSLSAQIPLTGPASAELQISSGTSYGQPWVGTLELTATMTCEGCAAG